MGFFDKTNYGMIVNAFTKDQQESYEAYMI